MNITDLPKQEQDAARVAILAMELGKTLAVSYDGLDRLVEVHAVGVSKTGRPCMRVFQTQGMSVSGDKTGWKLMTLDKVFTEPKLLDTSSMAPREGYKPGDLGMVQIFHEI